MKKDMLIVVPYRNRERDLKKFLIQTPQYFNNQNVSYDILICELEQNCSWNAGMSCNSLIDFIIDKEYEWVYIHHVDITPITGTWKFPNENEAYHNLGDFGSCLIKMKTFLEVGGYSNSFWGWGAEDNDLYDKLRNNGIKVITLDDNYQVKYDTEFQNHPRKFDGINYANNVKTLCLTPPNKKNNINNFQEYGYTDKLEKLSDSIYKQIVYSKKPDPKQHKNKNLVISYLKNENDPKKLMPFVKSAMMLSSYNFDLVICVSDETPDEYLLDQLRTFGVNVVRHIPEHKNLFIDRYFAYKNFLTATSQYENVLHVDCLDLIFQSDPFEFIKNELIINYEDFCSQNNENRKIKFDTIYHNDLFYKIKDKKVLSGAAIIGPVDKFIKLCDKIIQESIILDIPTDGDFDQTILNKLTYVDNIDVVIKDFNDNFCCNIPTHKLCEKFKNTIIVRNNCIFLNTKMQKFSIVHRYTIDIDINNKIYNHFNTYYYPTF
jgi:hypothetical protein